jgi:hypothetical protein
MVRFSVVPSFLQEKWTQSNQVEPRFEAFDGAASLTTLASIKLIGTISKCTFVIKGKRCHIPY